MRQSTFSSLLSSACSDTTSCGALGRHPFWSFDDLANAGTRSSKRRAMGRNGERRNTTCKRSSRAFSSRHPRQSSIASSSTDPSALTKQYSRPRAQRRADLEGRVEVEGVSVRRTRLTGLMLSEHSTENNQSSP